MNEDNLKLIYILKIGYNSKDEGLYEFIFSEDETNIDIEGWSWDLTPACDNALPPDDEYINATFGLRTSSFDLFCLHEAVDRPYMHGYHTIHALAYEVEKQDENGYSSYDKLMSEDKDLPLLVFHYGITLQEVIDLLYERNIVLKHNEFLEATSIKLI
jgi:hypothetical protein